MGANLGGLRWREGAATQAAAEGIPVEDLVIRQVALREGA